MEKGILWDNRLKIKKGVSLLQVFKRRRHQELELGHQTEKSIELKNTRAAPPSKEEGEEGKKSRRKGSGENPPEKSQDGQKKLPGHFLRSAGSRFPGEAERCSEFQLWKSVH